MNISKEELIKIALCAKLPLAEDKIPKLLDEIIDVLNYSETMPTLDSNFKDLLDKNSNDFRIDIILNSFSQKILEQAPKSENNLFVVPKFLGN